MKKIQYLILVAFTMLIFSCSNNNNKGFVPTFKGGDWINNNTIGYYGGHTSDCCAKVDPEHQYSYGFSKLISEISPNPIKKVIVSAWVKLSDITKKTIMVVSVSSPKKKDIFWKGHDVNPVVKEVNKWYKFEIEETLPDFDAEGAHIGIYLWNPNNNTAFVDDYDIKFLAE